MRENVQEHTEHISFRAQAWWAVTHIGMRHNVYFTSTNPTRTRFHLRDAKPDEGILVSVYYGEPNRVEVRDEAKKVRVL